MNGLDYSSSDNHIIIKSIPKINLNIFVYVKGEWERMMLPLGIKYYLNSLISNLISPQFFVSPVFQSGFPHIWYSETRLRFICNKNSSRMDPNCCKAHFEQLTFKCAPCCVTVWFLSRICLFLGSLFQLRLHLVAYLQN